MEKSLREIKKELVEICHIMHQKGFISATDGNLSVKISSNRILITASGINKGFMKESDIITIDTDGKPIGTSLKPSSEMRMHLIAYKLREDVKAVIHAHPTACTACSVAEVSLAKCILPEVVMTLGMIPTAGYATPGTGEIADIIGNLIKNYDAMILDRHGTLTLGKDLVTAYNHLEKMEYVANVTLFARQLGTEKFLEEKEVNRLITMGKKLGLNPGPVSCQGCGACGRKEGLPFKTKSLNSNPLITDEEKLVQEIIRKIENLH
ncbi:MAG: class II aldolase/adducin family protein [Bdellovibrio sp.]|nr:class II aldolase/adducin family protein [Bdellovibrio sp.]